MSTHLKRDLRDNVWHVCMHASWLHMTHTHTHTHICARLTVSFCSNWSYRILCMHIQTYMCIKTHLFGRHATLSTATKQMQNRLRWFANIIKSLIFRVTPNILLWISQIDTILLLCAIVAILVVHWNFQMDATHFECDQWVDQHMCVFEKREGTSLPPNRLLQHSQYSSMCIAIVYCISKYTTHNTYY